MLTWHWQPLDLSDQHGRHAANTFSTRNLTHLPPAMSPPQLSLIEQLHNLEAKIPVRARRTTGSIPC